MICTPCGLATVTEAKGHLGCIDFVPAPGEEGFSGARGWKDYPSCDCMHNGFLVPFNAPKYLQKKGVPWPSETSSETAPKTE